MNTTHPAPVGSSAPHSPRRGLLWLLVMASTIGSLALCLMSATVVYGIGSQLAMALQLPASKYLLAQEHP